MLINEAAGEEADNKKRRQGLPYQLQDPGRQTWQCPLDSRVSQPSEREEAWK